MKLLELIKLAFKNLFSYKVRSFLTMLGIIIGLSSVILISSIGNGFKNNLLSDVSKAYTKIIQVSVDELKMDKIPFKREYLFTKNDFDIMEKLPNVEYVFEEYVINGALHNDGKFTRIKAVTEKIVKIIPENLIYGSFFTTDEYEAGERVVIIDDLTAVKLYGSIENAIGNSFRIKINDIQYELVVKGIVKRDSSIIGDLYNIIIPKKLIDKNDKFFEILISVKDPSKLKETSEVLKKYLKLRTGIDDLYKIQSLNEQIQEITGILDKISLFITFIASISLIVGGIGVMNIMLVSVTERISEIGLRKAIGAKNRDILMQFLIESIILTLTGGVIGILFGYSIALISGIFLKITPTIPLKTLLVTVSISILIGIIFGIYPAKKAAKLSPIEALRNE